MTRSGVRLENLPDRRLLNGKRRVAPSGAEVIDNSDAFLPGHSRPWYCLVRDMQMSFVDILGKDWINAVFNTYMLGDCLLLQHEYYIEKRCHSSHGPSVPNVRLDGTNM